VKHWAIKKMNMMDFIFSVLIFLHTEKAAICKKQIAAEVQIDT